MTSPRPRDASEPGQKFTPFDTAVQQANAGCVNHITAGVPTAATTYTAGQQLAINWKATVPHPQDNTDTGVRIAVKYSGTDSFGDNILAGPGNLITPLVSAASESVTVTLPPGKTCDPCVLQWMWAARNDGGFYVSCADVAIRPPAPKPVPPVPVPDVVDDPAWLIATSGLCSNLNVVMKERDVEASETEGDTAAHFIADIEFNYYPQTAVKFTDFPNHLAKAIEGDAAEADALVSSAWDHKNIALLEPTSTCGADEHNDQAWGISVFKVKEHRHCTDGETAWEGHPCVHYSGYVSAATSNFVNVNEGRFVCQLFVDSFYGTTDPLS